MDEYIEKLSEAGVLKMTETKRKEIQENFWNTKRQTLNPNPALGLHYIIDSNKAKDLDRKGEFEQFINAKLNTALRIIDYDPWGI